MLQELDSDDAAAVFEDLEEDQQKAVLAAMPESEREAMVTSLAFEEETAGRLMQREVMAAPSFWNVGHTIDHMRENGDDLPELFFDIYVIDPSHKAGRRRAGIAADAGEARRAVVGADGADHRNHRRSGPGRGRLYL
ncbi:MAG: hypothetical protein WDN06_14085 [Asticcacaulis sp.]